MAKTVEIPVKLMDAPQVQEALREAADEIRRLYVGIEQGLLEHIDRACTCPDGAEDRDGNLWHRHDCPAVNPDVDGFITAMRGLVA